MKKAKSKQSKPKPKPKPILSGIIASKGKVAGKVFVIRGKASLLKFRPGSILVTEITNPSFVPAMSQAIGIITDIGGITSHATIISRELKTPCIVGTGNATQVLKDGDVVEVDANKGVVKIIKKSK